MQKTGILLLNLGTPSAPSVKAVRRYLRQFLADPYVIDLPWLPRMLLLHGVILPFRPKKTAEAYQAIWTDEGSPLLVHSQKFMAALKNELSEDMPIALGMRYGEPSIQQAVEVLQAKGCEKIIALALFPQYSNAANGSAIDALKKILQQGDYQPQLVICEPFYGKAEYTLPLAKTVAEAAKQFQPEHILFSYHGLPVRQLDKAGCDAGKCDRQASCLTQQGEVGSCYRAQCFYTSRAVADLLKLDANRYQTVFQSRLGKTPWIEPYTDVELPRLRERGIKRLMVVCPSFVVDCLETLEEIGLRLQETWSALGGEAFCAVPCLNDNPDWVKSVAAMLRQ